MNLENERKVKFWLFRISKILVIGYFGIKFIFLLLEKFGVLNSENGYRYERVQTAKLVIDDNIFSWKENNRKAILRIKNYSHIEGSNLKINATAHYQSFVDSILFEDGAFVNPNGIIALESNLDGLPLGRLPDSITICLVHDNENTTVKTWNQFRLNGFNKVLTQPLLEQATYNTQLVNKVNFENEVPGCFKKTDNIVYTDSKLRAYRIDSLKQLNKIKLDARIFLTGLNLKELTKVDKYATENLLNHLTYKDKDFEFGFNTEITILRYDAKTAYVKIFLTTEGWSHYLAKDFYYQMQNIDKTSESFYDFLEFDANTWNGKLIKQDSIWKFGIHESSNAMNLNVN